MKKTNDLTKDVEYYNKEKIEKNKEIIKIQHRQNDELSSSSDLVAYAPESQCLSERGQEEAEQDFSHSHDQAPTSPNDLVKTEQIHRALVQLFENPSGKQLQRRKLKIRLNIDLGKGIENVDFIAALTQDLGNFKKYHPQGSREYMQEWAMTNRRSIVEKFGVKPWMGKLHLSQGWQEQREQINQIEPWTAVLVWYSAKEFKYYALIRIYAWEEAVSLTSDAVTVRQQQMNVKAQTIWHNPQHYKLTRPKTWAEQRGLV